VSEAVLVTPA
jgi:hypothetical protein